MPAPDAVDGSSTGMAMRQNAVSVDDPPMSVVGIPAGCVPAYERLLLGVELPLDAGLA
jgi:hypothetical protein